MIRKVLLCTAVGSIALAVSCGKSAPSSPTPTEIPASATDGFLLKAGTAGIVSPTGGATADDAITLTASTTTGTYTSIPLSYHFQVRSGSTVVADGTAGPVSGSTVSYNPTGIDFNTAYTWRVQAVYNGLQAPWSADASFLTPEGAYIIGSELRDPLTTGRTVGQLMGNATLTPNGVSLPDLDSYVQYVLPQTLSAGSFSMMITHLTTSDHGAKSSVFSMGQGFGDITTNPYRFTADFRARDYPDPGAVTARIITGNPSVDFDSARIVVGGWDASKWYYWQASWQTGSYNLTVRQDSETGPILYNQTTPTNSHPYAPSPHILYLGKPTPRNGDIDETASQIVIKDVWASDNPRPHFPS
ncbi:MAG: hypothetical protein ACRD1V_20890 [Vicinamibacterales bacterium]